MLSRDFRPGGSLPTFVWGHVSTHIPAITAGHSLAPPSSTRNPIGLLCSVLSQIDKGELRAYRVSYDRAIRRFRSSLLTDSVGCP